jgi:hypothetical protein
LAAVQLDDKWGYIDTTGTEVTPLKYYRVWDFSEGMAVVSVDGNEDGGKENDSKGNDGSQDDDAQIMEKYGFIDETGSEVIPPEYDDADGFSEGLAAVAIGNLDEGYQWGFIDKAGNELIQIKYDEVSSFSERMAAVAVDGKWGFVFFDTSSYLYDEEDPGASVVLPLEMLAEITDKDSAIAAINAAIDGMTDKQKQSPTGIALVTLFAEEAIAQVAKATVGGSAITINQTNAAALQERAEDTAEAAEAALEGAGIKTQRALRADIKLWTNASTVTITLDPSAAGTLTSAIRVETPGYAVTIPASFINTEVGDEPLTITIAELDDADPFASATGRWVPTLAEMAGLPGVRLAPASPMPLATLKKFKIDFNREVAQSVKVSLPLADSDPSFQAVTNAGGDVAESSKYNNVTGTIDVRISGSDTYGVIDNKKDFGDIANKPKEMRDAIEILASKGIITGSGGNFNPDSPITRAEIAQIIVKALSKLDPNADGHFVDVQRNNWYFGTAGSAKRYGIFTGSGGRFMPTSNINKSELVVAAARTLRTELGDRNPANPDTLLRVYTDAALIASWGKTDIALATRENLVVRRMDGKFNGDGTVTRGDAAIILYRMLTKIW